MSKNGTKNGKVLVVGEIGIFPEIIKRCLIKLNYSCEYFPAEERMYFSVSIGNITKKLFEIKGVSYEEAEKLAIGLGLRTSDSFSWAKSNPILHLYHDGSIEAEKLRVEMLKLHIPYFIHRKSSFIGVQEEGIEKIHKTPKLNVDELIQILKEIAEKHKEEIESLP